MTALTAIGSVSLARELPTGVFSRVKIKAPRLATSVWD